MSTHVSRSQTLLALFEASETIDDFLAGFPPVSRAQVIAFRKRARTGWSKAVP